MGKNKKEKTMADVTKGYEKFIEGRELNNEGRQSFERIIKKATKPKQRGSK